MRQEKRLNFNLKWIGVKEFDKVSKNHGHSSKSRIVSLKARGHR